MTNPLSIATWNAKGVLHHKKQLGSYRHQNKTHFLLMPEKPRLSRT